MPLLVPYALARPFLFGLDPEQAHDLTLGALARIQRTPLICTVQQRRVADPVRLAGLTFPNRIGLAAGLDKNGRCIDGLAALGFGAIEVGTVTPKPQPGNPKPRMFRLPEANALINRLGFNNLGLQAFLDNVQRARSFRQAGGILGLNIGKNAATPIENATDDYLIGLAGVYPHADYVTVNISSPNTKNLRALQGDEARAFGPADRDIRLDPLALPLSVQTVDAVASIVNTTARLAVDVAVTRVTFAPMRDSDVAWYVATPEPYDKAGGYAVQGLASRFVTAIEGSYANVVGLPVSDVHEMCRALGILIS